ASDDGLTHTFVLRDTTWSNGDPVTADDVVWTFSYYFSPELAEQGNENPPRHDGVQSEIAGMADYYSGKSDDFGDVGVSAPDPHTVVFTLTAPSPFFLDSLVDIVLL